MAKKKFDTNQLDPTFPERAHNSGEAKTTALPKTEYSTSEFPSSPLPPHSVTEDETRRFNQADFNQYQSPFNGQQMPANYKHANFAGMNESSSRKVAKIGVSENILTAVPYIPWFIGLIAGILLLLYVPKSEAKVRFHAAQGLAAHLAILLITTILGFADNFFDLASAANGIFQIVTTIMLIIFAVKAWKGKPVHIESVDDLTEWLEEKINPRN